MTQQKEEETMLYVIDRYKTSLLLKRILLLGFLVGTFAGTLYGDEDIKYFKAMNAITNKIHASKPAGLIYRNPRVYNVDYSFELVPDPEKIDRNKDLKLWIPLPREWDSQRAVKIISIEPKPHGKCEDPEHGNLMLLWDFGKGPEKSVYKVNLKYRLISYEVHADVDPAQVGSYDKTNHEYSLYTRSTYRININPEVKKLAKEAIGDEENPYSQAKRICEFVSKKIRFKQLRCAGGSGVTCLLKSVATDPSTGQHYYEGECDQYSAFFVALCRATGIPARSVTGFVGWAPWMEEKNLRLHSEHYKKLTPNGLAAARIYGALWGHCWAECYVPNYGWIPVEPSEGQFGRLSNMCVIASKGRDVIIGPDAPPGESEGYGDQWISLHNGRADTIGWGVWNISRISVAKAITLQHSDPFPADAFAGYTSRLYQHMHDGTKRVSYRKGVLTWIYEKTQQEQDKAAALAKAYEENPWPRQYHEQYICHMLCQLVGDEKFFEIYKAYMKLLISSKKPVTTRHFQEIAEDVYGESLDWFFKQWVGYTELPQLRFDDITVSKDDDTWRVDGKLCQLSNSIFRLPVELKIETERQAEYKTIWLETRNTSFHLVTPDKPNSIIIDPNYHILKIQKMPFPRKRL